jgi:DNA polymerase III alpha subunit
MLKKLTAAVVGLLMTISLAFAQVDVNKADQATLDGVKGIGPKISQTIVDERTKNGKFKDWADFEARVKGIGENNAAKMSEAGLTVNGQSKSGAAARNDTKTTASTAKTDRKTSAKADKAQTAPSPFGAGGNSEAKTEAKGTEAKASKAKTESNGTEAKGSKAKTEAKGTETKVSSKKSPATPASGATGGATPQK